MAHWSDNIYFKPGGTQVPSDMFVGTRGNGPGSNYKWSISGLVDYMGVVGSFLAAGSAPITRSQQDKSRDIINIRDKAGCDPTGATNSDAAFAACYADALANGGLRVYLGSGTFKLSAPILLRTGLVYVGDGHTNTTITIGNTANINLVKTYNFDTLTGTNAWSIGVDNVPHSFGLVGLTINGNRDNNTTGSGVKIFGKRYIVDDVMVVSCAEYGFWSECGTHSGPTASYLDMAEAYIGKLWVQSCGLDGFHWEGPNDSRIDSVIAARCGHHCININKGTFSNPTADFGFMHGYGAGTDAAGAYIADYTAVRINATVRCDHIFAESAGGNALLVTTLGKGSQIGILRAFSAGLFAGAASKTCVVVQGDHVQCDNARIRDDAGVAGVAIQPGADFCQFPSLHITGNGGGVGTGVGLDVDSVGNVINCVIDDYDAGTSLRTSTTAARNNNHVTGTLSGGQLGWNNVASGNGNYYKLKIITPAASGAAGHFIGVGPRAGGSLGNDWDVFAILDNGGSPRYSKFTGLSASTFDMTATGRQALAIAHNALNGLTPSRGTCTLNNCGTLVYTVKGGPNIESFDATNMTVALNLSVAGAGTAQVGYQWAL